MIIPSRAPEHLVALQDAVLRLLATAAVFGIRFATRLSSKRPQR
jgi:hypothetical protein